MKREPNKARKLTDWALPAVFIIVGITIAIVTIIVPMINQMATNSVISQYEDTLQEMPEEDIQDAINGMNEYNQKGHSNYYTALDTETVVSYIEIPKINVYLPIFKGSSLSTLERGVGIVENTSMPIGGNGTHCVLAAHSGLTAQTMFNNISDLEKGDYFTLHTYGNELTYKITKTTTVLPEDVFKNIETQENKDFCTLMTCTPTGINTHRLLVTGERVDYEELIDDTTSSETTPSTNISIQTTPTDNKQVEDMIISPNATKGLSVNWCMIVCGIVSVALISIGTVQFISFIKTRKKQKQDSSEN